MATLHPSIQQRAADVLHEWQQLEQSRGVAPRVSSFLPHHSMTVRGPELRLASKYQAVVQPTYVGVRPQRMAQRHNPFDPIVFDEATTNHQGRQDRDENAFTSIAAVASNTPISDAAFATLGLVPHSDAHEFWNYLDAVQAWPGETLLRVLSYADQRDYAGSLLRTIVLATTVFPTQNGRARKIERYFLTRRHAPHPGSWPLDGPFGLPALSAPGAPPWTRDLIDVLLGDSDRALKHRMVEYQYTYARRQGQLVHNVEPVPGDDGQLPYAATLSSAYHFLGPRVPTRDDFQHLVQSAITPTDPATIHQDMRECPVCWETYVTVPDNPKAAAEQGACIALKLSCDHYTCWNCIVTHLWIRGIFSPCVMCRAEVLDDHQKDEIRYFVFPFAASTCPQDQFVFLPDSRWTVPENKQQSMSDLDRNLATDGNVANRLISTHNPHMLFDLWLYLVKLDDTYRDNDDHRCTLAPEWRTVVELTSRALLQVGPHGNNSRAVFDQLKDFLTAALRARMNSRQGLYNYHLCNAPATDLIAARKMRVWPSGMEAFWDRNTSRLLNYVRLRACDCHVDTNQARWHMERRTNTWQLVYHRWARHLHGHRWFYSPKVYDKLTLSAGEAWRY